MSLSFANATGNFYNRLGKLGAVVANIHSWQQTLNTNLTDTTSGIVAQFNAESDLQAQIGSTYLNLLSSLESPSTTVQSLAQATLNRMIYRDTPQLNQGLQSLNVLASLQNLILQMKQQGATVLAMTITATPVTVANPGPNFTGVGTGVINASVKRPSDGLVMENTFAETALFTCTGDSYNGTATAGNEPFTVTGTGNISDVFAFNWPGGSNATQTLNAIDGNTDNGSGNLLTNSGFNTFTGNVPSNWTLATGVAGTHIFQETSLVYDGAACIRFQGDGATQVALTQQFNSSSGTAGTLLPLAQYSFCVFMRRDGTGATGTLTVDMVDGSNTILLDANGVANTTNFDLSTLSTSYAPFKVVFRTPSILPSTVTIRLRQSTPYTNNRSFYVDKASFGPMSQFYLNGPYLAVHAGNVPFYTGDYGKLTLTNSRGVGGSLTTWQTLMYQLYPDIGNNGLLIPSSSSPTIADSLIS